MTDIGARPAEFPELQAPPRPRSPRRVLGTPTIAALGLLVVVLSTVAGVFVASMGPTEYGAEADLIFHPPDSIVEVERQLLTQQALLQSDVILRPVADEADVPLERLRAAQQVEVLTDSQVLRVTVGAASAEQAVGLAQGIAERYQESLIDDPPAEVGRAWLISSARPLDRPLRPRPEQGGAAGAIAGILAAGGLVLVLQHMRKRA